MIMKCVQCGYGDMQKTTTEHVVAIGAHEVTVVVAATSCPKCKEVYVSGETLERAELLVAEQIARSGNVSGDTLRFMRKVLCLQAKQLGELIDTPPETLSRWEKGARDVDRFAWVTVARMVIDKVEGHAPDTERLFKAMRKPTPFPSSLKVA